MPFLDLKRELYFRRWACAAPRAIVVVLHGFGEHGGHYHRFAHGLGTRRFDVWGLDLPGHGLSSGPRGDFGSVRRIAGAATQLSDLARRHNPALPVAIVGHSLGGVVAAMMCALGVPMDALVLTGAPLSGIPEDIAENPVMSADEFYLDALRHDPLGFDATAHEHVLRERIGECLGDIHEALCSNALPVLLVNGERDVVAPADVAGIWADKLPNATFHMISGGYHDIINDRQHEVVTTLVSDFITREACADFASITRDPADALDKEP